MTTYRFCICDTYIDNGIVQYSMFVISMSQVSDALADSDFYLLSILGALLEGDTVLLLLTVIVKV